MNTDLNNRHYTLSICGNEINYAFNNPETHKLFGSSLEPSDRDVCDIRVSYEYMNENRWLVSDSASEQFLEFQAVMLATGNYLLKHRCVLFHGVSFIWQGRAWILTAPSGTGKTTQLVNWMKLYGNQTQVINGDKTGLECREDGSVYAHSTPWRGKERIGTGGLSEKLGGIILLEQGEENTIFMPDPEETVYPLFIEFISLPETKRQILDLRSILEQMIDEIPVWKMINLGNEESTMLLHQTLKEYLEAEKEPVSHRLPDMGREGQE